MIIVKYKKQQHLVYEDYANQMFKDYNNPTDKEWMMHKLSVDLQTNPLWYEDQIKFIQNEGKI